MQKVKINVIVVDFQGNISTLVQRFVDKGSLEYLSLKKKYLHKEKDTLYDTVKIQYDVKKRTRTCWIETIIN